MAINTVHWADLPIIHDTESGIAAIEREQMTKPRPLEVEGPALHQPSSVHFPAASVSYGKDDFALDPYTQHTIQLTQYSQKLTSMIENARLISNKSGEAESKDLPCAPPIPLWTEPVRKHQFCHPIPYLPMDPDSLFVRGISCSDKPCALEIDKDSRRVLLRRSVGAICAHAGYDRCMQSSLDTLTDVCQDYIQQLTSLLRVAVDSQATNGGETGFQDAISRVFCEMGVGDVSTLFDFYQMRIVGYHGRLMHKCQQLFDKYEKLRSPPLLTPNPETSQASLRNQGESTIQFPSSEDTDDVSEIEQILIEGYNGNVNQTLQSQASSVSAGETDASGKADQSLEERSQDGSVHGDGAFVPGESRKESNTPFILKPPAKKFKK